MYKESLKQFVPSQACLKCEVCCRYPERKTAYVPYFFPEEIENIAPKDRSFTAIGNKLDLKTPPVPHRDRFICQFFVPAKNRCRIYPNRPLDCRFYPFMLTYGRDFESVVLALDTKCPYCRDKFDSKELKGYADYLVKFLDSIEMVEMINRNKNFINDFQEDSLIIKKLENVSNRVCSPESGLKRLSLKDKGNFDEYFLEAPGTISSFAFTSVYIWSPLLNILWKKIDDELRIFAGNDRDYFLFLPPVGNGATEESLKILRLLNGEGNAASRVENIPEELSDKLAQSGLKAGMASQEYIYSREEMAELRGDKFKSKRPLINKFLKKYKYRQRNFTEGDAFECLKLYEEWARQKFKAGDDGYFRALIEDSYFAQKMAMTNASVLNIEGLIIEINGEIRGYTLGFPLNKDVFVNLFETADLEIKGLSQFIFREFARNFSAYEYINTLSDSGLRNLQAVKESYHPLKKVKIFTAYL